MLALPVADVAPVLGVLGHVLSPRHTLHRIFICPHSPVLKVITLHVQAKIRFMCSSRIHGTQFVKFKILL
jgi:hypothetical protein